MGIFDALNTAVSGMRAQGYALQNISGNIANSQTTAFKRTDTTFDDLVQTNIPSQQLSGSVVASSLSTNTVQGDLQSAAVPTYMAINGQGFFVVQKPSSFIANQPTFSGINDYTRRGDFQLDQNGYLVNGAGYFLMGVPIDPTTGNPSGSDPQMLQFNNGFLPAQATTEVDYQANLAREPLTPSSDNSVSGSDLLNPADFTANPVEGAPAVAKITGFGATIAADAAAVLTGSNALTALTSAGGTLVLNGTSIAIAAGDNAAAIQTKINAQTGTTKVGATLNGTGDLELTGTDARTNITIGSATTLSLLSELGLSAGVTNATNLLTQSAAAPGQTLTVKVGSNPTLTVTFGSGAGQVQTLADLNTELATLSGGIASADPNTGNVTVTASSVTDSIVVAGDATLRNFGVRTSTAVPSNGTVIASDITSFTNELIAGGAITAYDTTGAAVNVQLRWAKVDSATIGSGHSDTWNLFYQTNSAATGTQAAWTNAGVNYVFGPNGQLTPPVNEVTLQNVSVDGVSLGNLRLVHGTGGLTQYADQNGVAQVNLLKQNGYAAGQLQSVAVSDKGRVTGTYTNGRTIDLAEITLANFSGANSLEAIDGGAYQATAESGTPTYNSSGTISGSSLEGSNTDIADEFSKLIVTQQAYSANTRVITTSNQMVQDLLNMLR